MSFDKQENNNQKGECGESCLKIAGKHLPCSEGKDSDDKNKKKDCRKFAHVPDNALLQGACPSSSCRVTSLLLMSGLVAARLLWIPMGLL